MSHRRLKRILRQESERLFHIHTRGIVLWLLNHTLGCKFLICSTNMPDTRSQSNSRLDGQCPLSLELLCEHVWLFINVNTFPPGSLETGE